MFAAIGIVVLIALVFGGFILAGGSMGPILAALPLEFMMIGGAALGATLIGNSMHEIKLLGGGLGKVFKGPKFTDQDHIDAIALTSKLMKMLRAEGAVALESHVTEPASSTIFSEYPKLQNDESVVGLICDPLTLMVVSSGTLDTHAVEDIIDNAIKTLLHEMEEREHAVARGARVLAEVRGFGAAMAPRPVNASFYGGEPASEAERGPDLGLERAVRGALAKAGLEAGDVDAIVPLAHGSRRTDDPERGALAQVFGDRLGSIPAITLPPMLGNTMAGQGGLMLIAGALAIAEQKLPARLHAGKASGLDAGAAGSRDAELGHVLVCATGMGGQSAAVVLGRAG